MATSFSEDVIGMCQKFGDELRINECIGASPPVALKLPAEKLIRTISGMNEPYGVALGERGNVIVTEYSRHCVSIFNSDGKKRSFGTRGYGEGQLYYPRGVALDGEGNILVASDGRIQKFSSMGWFLNVTWNMKFSCPDGIAFNSSNNKIYVTDRKKDCVYVLNSDLTNSRSDDINGSLNSPWGISCDSTGKVYVADNNNHCIQVSSGGRFRRMFGDHSLDEGDLYFPSGIAIDTNGVIYVSERGHDRISVFTSEGQFISSFGTGGSRPGEFNDPQGLAVNKDGVLYVCDYSNNRIQVLSNCFKLQ